MFLHLNGPCLYDFVPMLVWFRTHACMILYPCLCDFLLMLVWFRAHACVISYSCLYDFAPMLRTRACMISYSCLYDFVLMLVWFRTHACMISYSVIEKLIVNYLFHRWSLQQSQKFVEWIKHAFHLSSFHIFCTMWFYFSSFHVVTQVV